MGRSQVKELPQLVVFRGDTRRCVLNLEDDQGNNRNLTGNSYRLVVSRERNPTAASAVAAEIMDITGVIIGDPLNGDVGFPPAPADWTGVLDTEFAVPEDGLDAILTAYYDVIETDAQPEDLTIGKGVFVIVQDIGK